MMMMMIMIKKLVHLVPQDFVLSCPVHRKWEKWEKSHNHLLWSPGPSGTQLSATESPLWSLIHVINHACADYVMNKERNCLLGNLKFMGRLLSQLDLGVSVGRPVNIAL